MESTLTLLPGCPKDGVHLWFAATRPSERIPSTRVDAGRDADGGARRHGGDGDLIWTRYDGAMVFSAYQVLRNVLDQKSVDTLAVLSAVEQTAFR